MSGRRLVHLGAAALAVVAMAGAASAEPERVFSYPVAIGQTGPRGALARGPDGTLYAALYGIGPSSRGSVVAYRPPATVGGSWTVSLLHGFNEPEGGRYPQAGVTLGPTGELYGTTVQGGANDRGVVYRLTPPATPGDPWTKDILHQFGLSDGFYPSTNLLLDPDGALYGTTEGGGPSNCGLVFRLKPRGGGAIPWSFKALATFSSEVGCTPRSALARDEDGALYGSLFAGGPAGLGAVYRLQPISGGKYKLKTLKSFEGDNSLGSPVGDLVFDALGGVIGAARGGGGDGCGGIYRLAPPPASGGKWGFQKIRSLSGGASGCFPLGVARDPFDGALAVTTYQGGSFNVGALLKLTPRDSGPTQYGLKLRESFGPTYNYPQGSPVVGPDGEVFGTTTDAISIWRSAP